MIAKEFSILPPLSFIADVRREAHHAKKRIYLQAMEVEPGEISNHLLEILEIGREKDLDVRLHVDHYSLLVTDGYFNYIPSLSSSTRRRRKARLKRRIEYFSGLQRKGVKLTFTNKPSLTSRLFPMFGRNHMKIAVIDDTAYIGGINYHDANFQSNDCMVKLKDPRIVSYIVNVFCDIEEGKLTKDRHISCTETTDLYIDSGKVGKSLILQEAVKLIHSATSTITLITPIIPDSQLLRALTDAQKRGLKIHVIVPAIKKMTGVYYLLDSFNQLSLSLQFKHIPIIYKPLQIHAKMIIVDNEKVLLGSHNLTNRGVLMGTEEIAMISSDTYFVSQAQAFIDHVIKS